MTITKRFRLEVIKQLLEQKDLPRITVEIGNFKMHLSNTLHTSRDIPVSYRDVQNEIQNHHTPAYGYEDGQRMSGVVKAIKHFRLYTEMSTKDLSHFGYYVREKAGA